MIMIDLLMAGWKDIMTINKMLLWRATRQLFKTQRRNTDGNETWTKCCQMKMQHCVWIGKWWLTQPFTAVELHSHTHDHGVVGHGHEADKACYDGRLQILQHHVICIPVPLDYLAEERRMTPDWRREAGMVNAVKETLNSAARDLGLLSGKIAMCTILSAWICDRSNKLWNQNATPPISWI